MATYSSEKTIQNRGTYSKRFNWDYFLQDNVTGSPLLLWGVIILGLITLVTLLGGFSSAPARTSIILGAWLLSIALVAVGELFTLHNSVSRWLQENILSSVINSLLTLLLLLVVGLALAALYEWGFATATFGQDQTHPDVRSEGASWGVILGARDLLMVGRFPREHLWRVGWFTGAILGMWALTIITSRQFVKDAIGESVSRIVSSVVNVLWVVLPFFSYILLAGITYDATEPFINISTLIIGAAVMLALMGVLWFFKVIRLTPVSIAVWAAVWPIGYVIWRYVGSTEQFGPVDTNLIGGLLLTVLFAIFVNLLSLPIGVTLALGRRAVVQGIPIWVIWGVSLVATAYFIQTSTLGPEGLYATSRNWVERIIAFWPLIMIFAALYFHRAFHGNVVQAFSVLFIELIRGVPLITLLFMAIIMSPFFTPEGSTGINRFWAVVIGYTIFSSAYMAELVRGGLQAIPKGQYEASYALGFNTLQTYRFIILPQALRILIPPLAGSVIGTFKSSSLVSLIGMFDLVGVTRAIIANEDWLGLRKELYAFMFVLYFVVSAVVSWYSRRLEERTGLGVR